MNKKFFTLLRGEEIQIAPKVKVIQAIAFSEMLSAEEILKKVQEDANQYKKQTVEECEKLKEQAQQEGFEEGFKKWAEHVVELENEIDKVQKETEKLILPLALKTAKKIVGREIELSEDIIIDIVRNHLKEVSSHKKIKVYVNKSELAILEKNKTSLKDIFENLESIGIFERNDVLPGGCVIETEGGIINAQLENQWGVLERAFERLIKQHAQ